MHIKLPYFFGCALFPVHQRINAREPFAAERQVEHCAGFRATAFHGCVARKKIGVARFDIHAFGAMENLTVTRQCKVDMMQIITFTFAIGIPLQIKTCEVETYYINFETSGLYKGAFSLRIT